MSTGSSSLLIFGEGNSFEIETGRLVWGQGSSKLTLVLAQKYFRGQDYYSKVNFS
jgi:hypothetical protein